MSGVKPEAHVELAALDRRVALAGRSFASLCHRAAVIGRAVGDLRLRVGTRD